MPAMHSSIIFFVLLVQLAGCEESTRASMDTTPATPTPVSSASAAPFPTATETATPTAILPPELPDLVPLGVREVGCGVSVHGDTECLYLILEVCTENAGVAAAASSVVRVDGQDIRIPALAAGESHCDQFSYRFGAAVLTVDVLGEVTEADESNNTQNYPQPNGTRCDTCEVKRRPAPTPKPPGR